MYIEEFFDTLEKIQYIKTNSIDVMKKSKISIAFYIEFFSLYCTFSQYGVSQN